MDKFWAILLGVFLFIIITFSYWKVTKGHVEKTYGKKIWNQWGTKMFYWSGAFFISGGITVGLILLLKSGNILAF